LTVGDAIYIHTGPLGHTFEVLDGQVQQDEALGDSEATHQSEETAEPPGLRRFNLLTGEVERRRSGWGSGRRVVDQSEASESWWKQS